jgi:hypothetical protein
MYVLLAIANIMIIFCYSLRPILLFANMDVSTINISLDTSKLAKSIMSRREYKLTIEMHVIN